MSQLSDAPAVSTESPATHLPISPAAITAVILCGGRGERLNDPQKPLKPFCGEPLLQRVLRQLQPQVAQIELSLHTPSDTYAAFQCPIRIDVDAAHALGPIAGIVAALQQARTPWLLVVPADAPLLPPDLVARLSAAASGCDAQAAYVIERSGPQPLVCLLHARHASALQAFVNSGQQSPLQWLRQLAAATVAYADWPQWAWSMNTAEEWQFAESQAANSPHLPSSH